MTDGADETERRTTTDESTAAPGERAKRAERVEHLDHLADVADGCGCAEVWEHLSERVREE